MLLPVIQTISSKGQLVIPAHIRKALGLVPGSKVSIMPDVSSDSVRIAPVQKDPVKALTGLSKRYKFHRTFRESLQDKYDEIKRGE